VSGTNAAAAKARLVGKNGLLAGLPGLQGVDVQYDMPRDVLRETVAGVGDVEGEPDLAAMRNNARSPRTENLSMNIEVKVYKPGQATREEGDARAVEIADVIVEWIAANPTLGDLPDLKLAKVANVNLRGGLDDDGATSSIVLTIGLLSYLT
jgi:hypothetical protein